MSLSIDLDPILETQLVQEARRLGMTEAEFVKDTLERVLGLKNPSDLLDQICSYTPMGDPNASENISAKIKAKLDAQHTS